MSRLLLAIALLCSTALADTSIKLVKQAPESAGHVKATVNVGSANIDPAVFAKTLLDCANYPMTATYMSTRALVACETLESSRADGQSVIYQRSGGKFPISERHWVIALRVSELTADKAVVSWDLVQHAQSAEGSFAGPFAQKLNAHPDAVYTPYNSGYWEYNKPAGTITYSATSDPGGTLPSWMVSESAAMAFPKELLRVKFDVDVD